MPDFSSPSWQTEENEAGARHRADAAEADRRLSLSAKEQHLMDVYDALGVKWGEDPFPVIAALRGSLPGGSPTQELDVQTSGREP